MYYIHIIYIIHYIYIIYFYFLYIFFLGGGVSSLIAPGRSGPPSFSYVLRSTTEACVYMYT